MKPLFKIILPILCIQACSEDSNYARSIVSVRISEITIPKEAQVNHATQIHLKAEATSGCYSNLTIHMNEMESNKYSFKATAIFETYGTCTDNIVYMDTTIGFTTAIPGKYFFHTYETPERVRIDTLEIK